jgi:hypothetical protein
MKIKNLISFLLIMLLISTCSDDSSESVQYNITGTWIGPYDGETGSGTLYMYMIQTGSNVTGTYSAPAGEDTGTVVGNVEDNEFLTTVTSLPYVCETYMKFTIQDSLHMSGYYRGYETCEDTGSVSLVKQ